MALATGGGHDDRLADPAHAGVGTGGRPLGVLEPEEALAAPDVGVDRVELTLQAGDVVLPLGLLVRQDGAELRGDDADRDLVVRDALEHPDEADGLGGVAGLERREGVLGGDPPGRADDPDGRDLRRDPAAQDAQLLEADLDGLLAGGLRGGDGLALATLRAAGVGVRLADLVTEELTEGGGTGHGIPRGEESMGALGGG